MFKLISLVLSYILFSAASLPVFAANGGAVSPSDSFAKDVESFKTITNTQYIAGGVLSIVVGFGAGHGAQGRWSEKGWIFTAGEAVSLIGVYYGFLAGALAAGGGQAPTGKLAIGGISLVALMGFRIWEMIDAWMLPSHYKVADSQLRLQPFVYHSGNNGAGFSGLALNYKF